MRDIKEHDDSETPLLDNEEQVVIISNQSDSDSASARTPRRSRSTTERFRSRSSAHLAGARRTPSNLNKSSNDTGDRQTEVYLAYIQFD